MPPDQGHSSYGPVRDPLPSATQSVFDWLDLLFREGRPLRRNVIVHPPRPEHPLRKPQMPALSGLWASRACYPVSRNGTGVPPAHGRDTSHQSLQPTCCHEYPRSHLIPKLWAFALPTAAILLVLPSGWAPSLPLEAFLGCAGWPFLASPALGQPRSWCCAAELLPNRHPRRGRAVSRALARGALSARLEPDGPDRRRPLSLPASWARHPGLTRRSQDSLPRDPTKGHGSSSPRRLPPASPTADARARARTATAWAATGTLAWPPAVQLPTCVHAPPEER